MILDIDTSNKDKVTVALQKNGKVLNELRDYNKFGSQVLLPLIVKVLKKAGKDLKDIKAIKVNTGPGSFTGIRVGVSVANALGFSLEIPVNGKKMETELKYS